MHDGSTIRLHKLAKDWDPLDRSSAIKAMHRARAKGEILTGLLFVDPDSSDLHNIINTTDEPLNALTKTDLCPGSAALEKLNQALR
jgi:2-oxoglutarate ferredoxin oxidoreductase subunit beta